MRRLGEGKKTNLVVKEFDRRLHMRLRSAAGRHNMTIRAIVEEALREWMRSKSRKKKPPDIYVVG